MFLVKENTFRSEITENNILKFRNICYRSIIRKNRTININVIVLPFKKQCFLSLYIKSNFL